MVLFFVEGERGRFGAAVVVRGCFGGKAISLEEICIFKNREFLRSQLISAVVSQGILHSGLGVLMLVRVVDPRENKERYPQSLELGNFGFSKWE